jgi:VWFA-related protein
MRKLAVPLLLSLGALYNGSAQTGNPPPEATGPAIRVTTTEVALDLTVRDKRGRVVKNLKPEDVEIYEDGVRQKVLSFRMAGTRATARVASGTESEPKPVEAHSRALRSVNVVCVVFHNLDPVSRLNAVGAVEEFLKSDMTPETYVGFFSLTDVLSPVHQFTNNREEILQAVKSELNGMPMDFGRASEALLTANPTQATVDVAVTTSARGGSATATMRVTGGEISKSVITGADVSNSTGANLMRGDQVRERGDFSNINGMRETDKIITMVNQLGTLPGRKTVLLVTTGFLSTGDPDRFQSILSNANRLGITIYSLDTTGLRSDYDTVQAGRNALGRVAAVSRQQTAVNNSLAAMRENSRQNDNMNDAVRASDTQASLRALSEGTGGFLIANTNDFRKPFAHILEEMETHYEAVYRPASTKYDGRLRKIEVKLARNDLQVESRTGYFAMPDLKGSGPLTPLETTALAVLNAQPAPHDFDFRSTAYHFRSDGTNSQNSLAFEVEGASLGSSKDAEHKARHFDVGLLALVKDANGEVVDKFTVDSPYDIPEANVAAVQANAITYTHPVRLPPGRYTVETAVLDREARRASTSTFQMDSPGPPKGVGLSSLMLVQNMENVSGPGDNSDPLQFRGKRLVPLVESTVHPGTKRYVYFAVYPDKSNSEKPKIQVEFLAGGEVFAKQMVDLPAPDATGAIPMFVAAATRPGSCELRITAMQGSASATQSVDYSVAAN